MLAMAFKIDTNAIADDAVTMKRFALYFTGTVILLLEKIIRQLYMGELHNA